VAVGWRWVIGCGGELAVGYRCCWWWRWVFGGLWVVAVGWWRVIGGGDVCV
jgi:hypothetical protein